MRMTMRFWFVIVLLFSLTAASAPTETAQSPKGDFEISGTVVDSRDGEPISGARVTLSAVNTRDDLPTVTSGDDGRFSFRGIVAGHYDISAQKRGYIRQSFDQHGAYATSIVTGPGLDSGNLVFRLTAECSITGTIVDEAGEAGRDAEISLYQLGNGARNLNGNTIAQAITDGEGSYSFPPFRPAQFFLSFPPHV